MYADVHVCTCTLRYFLYQDVSTEYGCSFDLSEEIVACVMSVVEDLTYHFISLAISILKKVRNLVSVCQGFFCVDFCIIIMSNSNLVNIMSVYFVLIVV